MSLGNETVPILSEYLKNLVDERWNDENKTVEWKSHMRFSESKGKNDDDISEKIIQTLTAFANTEGGKILIGWHEKRQEWTGIEKDGFTIKKGEIDKDGWIRHLEDKIQIYTHKSLLNLLDWKFVKYDKNTTCAIITIERSESLFPFMVPGQGENWYFRSSKRNVALNKYEEKEKYEKGRNTPLHRGWSFNNYAFIDKDLMKQSWKDAGIVTSDFFELLPPKNGLYIYYIKVPSSEDTWFSSFQGVLYVGKGNIADRARDHIGEPSFDLAQEVYDNDLRFAYCLLNDSDMNKMNIWEGQMIDMFSPPLNLKREAVRRKKAIIASVGKPSK
tara:strand:- start:273 stop:1262 length:990 start_codon:yes stop_codon:yes gene_type:complete